MSEADRSELACPICSQHTLALDQPPRIDVMGVQLYSDIVGMGDLQQSSAPRHRLSELRHALAGPGRRSSDGEPELDAAAGPDDVEDRRDPDSRGGAGARYALRRRDDGSWP